MFLKETIWKGNKFEGARNLFMKYNLIKYMHFYEAQIRLSEVRFCCVPEKGIFWLKSDRGFIKSKHVSATKLQDPKISLMSFTPNGAFDSY